MRTRPAYTPYHPRWYRARVSTYWWLERPAYLVFILRELSSLFVAWAVVYLLLLVRALGQGEVGYQRFLEWSGSLPVLLLNGAAFLFVTFHAVTWFNLAAQALVLHAGRRRIPGVWITAANYLAWVLASAAVAWLLLGG